MQMDASNSDEHQSEPTPTAKESQVSSINSVNSLKILRDIKALGCSKDEFSTATYRTYLDLCEVRKYESVSYHYTPELDLLYLRASKKIDGEAEIIIPIVASKPFDFNEMEKLQDSFSSNFINLAICDSSSIIMYYKLTRNR